MPATPTQFPARSQLPVDEIAAAIEALIDLLNKVAGDPDLEPDGDELDGTHAEDEDGNHLGRHGIGPGCPIADPAEEDDPSDTGNAEDEAITGEIAHYATRDAGAGCSLSDPGGCEHDGREPEFGV